MHHSLTEHVQGDILVVDDTPTNLRVLSGILTQRGYQVRSVINGRMALMAVETAPPDLILLDIRMPEMDGYEVCQRLKADSSTCDIPVIFISALDEVVDKVKAFELGAVDYITKPFQIAEVEARLKTHLTLRRLQQHVQQQKQQLQVQNVQLQQEIVARQQAEAKYRSIFENCLEGIFQTTAEGRFINANPALARIYGYQSPTELMASVQDISTQLYVFPGRRDELNSCVQQYGQVIDFESEIYRKDGSTIWILENVHAVTDETGQILYYEGTVQNITERRQMEAELQNERRNTELLLFSVLPQPIAERLKHKQGTIADSHGDVTVLFADVVNFTSLSSKLSATELVDLLNQIFSTFDRLAEHYSLEKIKTIGDEYMVAGGLPLPKADHAEAIAEMALAMQEAISQFHSQCGQPLQLRIGINCGEVTAGVMGTKRLSYDLWGDTVNLASRMESHGLPGQIQVAPAAYERLKSNYWLEERGTIPIKGLGEMTTYWLKGRKDQVPQKTLIKS